MRLSAHMIGETSVCVLGGGGKRGDPSERSKVSDADGGGGERGARSTVWGTAAARAGRRPCGGAMRRVRSAGSRRMVVGWAVACERPVQADGLCAGCQTPLALRAEEVAKGAVAPPPSAWRGGEGDGEEREGWCDEAPFGKADEGVVEVGATPIRASFKLEMCCCVVEGAPRAKRAGGASVRPPPAKPPGRAQIPMPRCPGRGGMSTEYGHARC